MEVWRLTDQEIKAVELSGGNLAVAEGAKRQAFIDNGGVILNPDALSDLHKALKQFVDWQSECEEHKDVCLYREMLADGRRALSKAEAK